MNCILLSTLAYTAAFYSTGYSVSEDNHVVFYQKAVIPSPSFAFTI